MQQDKLCNARNLLRGARGHKAGALQRFEAWNRGGRGDHESKLLERSGNAAGDHDGHDL